VRTEASRLSDCKTFAAFHAARLDHIPAGAVLHLVAKTVTTFATSNFGLICPLHEKYTEGIKGGEPAQITRAVETMQYDGRPDEANVSLLPLWGDAETALGRGGRGVKATTGTGVW
jgi:hypothetical protein